MGWHRICYVHDEMQFDESVYSCNDSTTNFERLSFNHQENLIYVSPDTQANDQRLFHVTLNVALHNGIDWFNRLDAKQIQQTPYNTVNTNLINMSFRIKKVRRNFNNSVLWQLSSLHRNTLNMYSTHGCMIELNINNSLQLRCSVPVKGYQVDDSLSSQSFKSINTKLH
jgi:hypothetical protein